MGNEVQAREIIPIDIKEGYLIDGFPYTGLANAIATESLVNTTSQFELAGVLDSELFPPISIVRDEVPNFPARILVNKDLKVAVFSSYLTPHESIHRDVARVMLKWASDHKCSFIISSSAIKSDESTPSVIGVCSTEAARKKLRDADIPILKNGTIPGIPGILLNEGAISNISVIVLLCKARETGPDFRAGAEICMAMTKLVPGASCNLKLLLNEAEGIEQNLKQTEQDAGPLRDAIYG
ncbi:MAG: proteasome assembly chaperone family protein [Thaumarchaeota archaeon]|nr:proteasome assembly chaperone family protein [Nitrososphaerota archaeon]MDE1817270.1 proteasome assembly chaperone family protein [Nitrososphaerota archaeon]MDE1875493.1 proteasome assembly chaperone family protein [Nitrososphaerota archaeon]